MMELNSLDEEQNNLSDAPLPAVSGIPPIIFVKEYINQSDSDNNDSTINSNVSKDERISLNPSQLEGSISVKSYNSAISHPDNEPIETEKSLSIVKVLLNVINGDNFQFLIVVSICISSFLSMVLIPYHNVILLPFFWYEAIFIGALGGIPCSFGVCVVQIRLLLEYQDITRPMTILKGFLLFAVCYALIHVLVHLSWSVGLGYNSPIPYSFGINVLFSTFTSMAVIWYVIPQDLKSRTVFQDRLKALFYYFLLAMAISAVVPTIIESVKQLSTFIGTNIQWLIAVLLLFVKINSQSMMVKSLTKFALPQKRKLAKSLVIVENGVMFKAIILVLIGSKTDVVTGYCFQGISMIMLMKSCYNIIHLHLQKGAASRKRKIELLTALMLNETLEFFTTVAYVLCTTVAYYGPNAGIIGNIQNNYWQFHIIDSFPDFITAMSYSLLIDISSGIITLIVLRYFCRINGLLYFKDKIGQYSNALALCIAREINFVSIF